MAERPIDAESSIQIHGTASCVALLKLRKNIAQRWDMRSCKPRELVRLVSGLCVPLGTLVSFKICGVVVKGNLMKEFPTSDHPVSR